MNIKLKNLYKKYFKKIVFEDLNLEIESGLIHCIVGSDKSGKSTLVKLITRKTFANKGEVLYDDNKMCNKTIPIVICPNSLLSHERLLSKDYLKDVYPNFDSEYATSLIKKFNIVDVKGIPSPVKEDIAGYNVCIALACNEDVVVFDDNVDKLNDNNKIIFYEELLKKYEKDKQTFIIASKQLNHMDHLFDNYILLNNKSAFTKKRNDVLEDTYVIKGEIEFVKEYMIGDYIITNSSDDSIEVIIFNKKNNYENVIVREASLDDILRSYGDYYEL